MRIMNLRRTPGDGSVVARFDIEVSPDVTLLEWSLKTGGRVFPPSPRHGLPAARVSAAMMAEITRLANEGVAHVRT